MHHLTCLTRSPRALTSRYTDWHSPRVDIYTGCDSSARAQNPRYRIRQCARSSEANSAVERCSHDGSSACYMIHASYSTVLLRPNVNIGGAAPRNVGAHKCGTSTLLFSESTTGASPNRWTASLSVPKRVRAAAGVAVTFFITAGELTRLFGFCGELRRTRFTQTGELASFDRIGDRLTRGCAGLSTAFFGLVRVEAGIGDAGCSGIVASEKSEASENRARR